MSGERLFLVRARAVDAYGEDYGAADIANALLAEETLILADQTVTELTPPGGDAVMLVGMARADWQTIAAMITAAPDKHPCGTRLLNAITTQVGVNADTILALLNDTDTDPGGLADGTT